MMNLIVHGGSWRLCCAIWRNPAGIALKDLFTDDDDECSSPLQFCAPATSTSQATIEHPTTGTLEILPSQDRMRIVLRPSDVHFSGYH